MNYMDTEIVQQGSKFEKFPVIWYHKSVVHATNLILKPIALSHTWKEFLELRTDVVLDEPELREREREKSKCCGEVIIKNMDTFTHFHRFALGVLDHTENHDLHKTLIHVTGGDGKHIYNIALLLFLGLIVSA